MNVERLVRMALRLLLRHGMKHAAKGQKTDPRIKTATRSVKMARRIGRL